MSIHTCISAKHTNGNAYEKRREKGIYYAMYAWRPFPVNTKHVMYAYCLFIIIIIIINTVLGHVLLLQNVCIIWVKRSSQTVITSNIFGQLVISYLITPFYFQFSNTDFFFFSRNENKHICAKKRFYWNKNLFVFVEKKANKNISNEMDSFRRLVVGVYILIDFFSSHEYNYVQAFVFAWYAFVHIFNYMAFSFIDFLYLDDSYMRCTPRWLNIWMPNRSHLNRNTCDTSWTTDHFKY